METELNACEAMLKPSNKKQQKQLDNLIKLLDLKTKGEIFILNCVLYMDWSRQKILQSIEHIKESEDGKRISFKITMRAPSLTTDYSISNPYTNGDGWHKPYNNSLEQRCWYIYHQMDYYTKKL